MTDSRLQQLKRAREASGSVADEAAYLRERVRVGELSQEALEVAAYCGNAPAGFALDVEPTDPLDVVTWLEGMHPEALIRGRLAVATEFAERWLAGSDDHSLEELVQASAHCVTCPCAKHRGKAEKTIHRVVSNLHLHTISRLPNRQAQAMLQVALGTALVVANVSHERVSLPLGFSKVSSTHSYTGTLGFASLSLRVLQDEELRGLVAQAVVPWALE